MKIGVVIQGPIISQGFDSTSTIKRNIEEYLQHPSVAHIVVSIWKGERFTYSHPKITVLHNTPPTGRDINNRRRQWISTLQGTQYLKRRTAVTHVLKIRTDQYVPSAIIDFMSSFYIPKNLKIYYKDPDWKSEIVNEPLLFSSAYRISPFFVTDFYFAGHIDDIVRLMKNNLAFSGHIFQLAPEVDLILKHLFKTDADFALTRVERYTDVRSLITAASSHKIWEYWYAVHRLYFGCFPKSVFSKVTWRGMKWTEFHDQRLGEVRAKHIVDTYFDFTTHWQMLHKNPRAYTQLPRDLSGSQHVTKREWFYTVRGIMESFFVKL
ncbi:MAG: hypothetical protein H0W89_02755 [Candidatus Levybacteria bacterium]|nr:hypothetical protein [Candidatus Levybacteria bacterium]